jgi:hypothetical protein
MRVTRVRMSDEVEVTSFQFNWHGRMPLFRGMDERMSHNFTFSARYGRPIFWETRAPGMLNRAGFLITGNGGAVLRPFDKWKFVEGSETF